MHISFESRWNDLLQLFPENQKDIYFTEEYASLNSQEGTPVAVVCREEDNILLMPIIKKNWGDGFDFETPYGYGGPISTTTNKEWSAQAVKELKDFLLAQGFIAGFIRFHPLLDNGSLFVSTDITVVNDRNTVAIELSHPEDEIWMDQLSSKNRNTIRKAVKNGLSFEADYDFLYKDDFLNLYHNTMVRLEADDTYLFPRDYYDQFFRNFKNHAFLGVVKKDNLVISAAIFMYQNAYGHYHLAGSNPEYLGWGANNFLLWQAALELKKQGVSLFHLGGGTDGNEKNSLYRFKRSFSHNLFPFRLGKFLINEIRYQDICRVWADENPEKAETLGNILLRYRY